MPPLLCLPNKNTIPSEYLTQKLFSLQIGVFHEFCSQSLDTTVTFSLVHPSSIMSAYFTVLFNDLSVLWTIQSFWEKQCVLLNLCPKLEEKKPPLLFKNVWRWSVRAHHLGAYSGHRTKVDKDCDLWCAGKEEMTEARDWGKHFILQRLKRLTG